jgi:hypothetical protein
MIDFGLVDLVYEGNESQIDELLLTKLKNLNEEEYWIADNFMNILKYKNTSKEMDEVIEEFKKLQFEFDKNLELKIIIEKFIQLIDK